MPKSQRMSRRGVLSLFGFGATLFAIPTTDAEAQTSGMERRQGRVERRYERRGGTSAQQQPAGGQPAPSAPPPQKQ
jgi:hypothetical protein